MFARSSGTRGPLQCLTLVPLALLAEPAAAAPRAQGPASGAEPEIRLAPNSAPVRINELMPNPPGDDAWGKEYVELVNMQQAPVDVRGWQVRDQDGALVATLPSHSIPGPDPATGRRNYLVVFLSPVMSSQIDPSYGGDFRAVVFAGGAGSLANDRGALSLHDTGGELVDAVLFGDGPVVGLGVDAIRAAGHWVGPRFDTSFANGRVPLGEGGVIGRDLDSSDYDMASDFRVQGVRTASGRPSDGGTTRRCSTTKASASAGPSIR